MKFLHYPKTHGTFPGALFIHTLEILIWHRPQKYFVWLWIFYFMIITWYTLNYLLYDLHPQYFLSLHSPVVFLVFLTQHLSIRKTTPNISSSMLRLLWIKSDSWKVKPTLGIPFLPFNLNLVHLICPDMHQNERNKRQNLISYVITIKYISFVILFSGASLKNSIR